MPDLSNVTTIVTTLGFPATLVLILIYFMVKYINRKDTENREDTKEQIELLRKENKEDKRIFRSAIEDIKAESKEDRKMFEKAIDSFNIAVVEFKNIQRETNSIKDDIEEVKQDILIIKTKIDK